MEQPLYSCKPYLKKRLISGFIVSLAFSILFYFILIFNLIFLDFDITTKVNIIIASFLIALMALTFTLNYVHSKKTTYLFFGDRIEINGKSLYFRDIKNINGKSKFMDRFFKTGSLKVNEFQLEDLQQPQNVEKYLLNLTRNYQYYMNQNGRQA